VKSAGDLPSSGVAGQPVRKLGSGSDAELPEDFAEVIVDGAGTQEELLRDLAVGRAAGGEVGNAGLLGSYHYPL
jgi:hypothetical protein